MEERLKAILLRKPELIADFPPWMLPRDDINRIRATEDVVIIEVAGRDSFAALFKYMENHSVKGVVPTIAYTATEYGDWISLYDNLDYMKDHLRSLSVHIYSPVFMGSPALWKRVCGSITAISLAKFGFYTPCIGCHLYLHGIRIPLALQLGIKTVIAGERESHDSAIKINQISVSLDGYIALFKLFGLSLEMPLRHISKGSEIESLLGISWEGGRRQLDCVLSGNYVGENGCVAYSEESIQKYLNDFAVPLMEEYIRKAIASPF